jgi:type III secretion protein S
MIETLAFFQKGLILVVWLTLPPLAVAVISGVLISLIQTVMSLQDQALPFAAKLLAVGLTLALVGRWMGVELITLGSEALQAIATIRPYLKAGQ